MPTNPDELRVQMVLPAPEEAPPPEPVNYFHFSIAGLDVQMMVGYVDPRSVHSIAVEKTVPSIAPRITHRFAISPSGFAILRKQLEEIGPAFDSNIQKGQKATGIGQVGPNSG